MKKIISALKGALLIAIISFNQVNGQEMVSGNSSYLNPAKSLTSVETGKANAPVIVANVSQRAIKNFANTFKNKIQPVWSNSSDGGCAASFTEADIQNCFYYDKKGNWTCNIKRYDESKMSKEIRQIVKPVYYDYKINGIAEIVLLSKIVYLLYVQDAHNFKTVRISEGEMDVIEWFKDGKIVSL